MTEQAPSDAPLKIQDEFRAVLAALTDLFTVLDSQGRYLEVRNASPDLLFGKPEALIGRTLDEVLPSDVAAQSLDAVRTSLAERKLVTIQYTLDLPERRWFESRIFPIDDHRVIALARDITQYRLAEKGAAQYAERLRILHEIDESILVARSPAAIALAALGRLRRMIGCQRVTVVEFGAAGETTVLGVEAETEFSTAMEQRVAALNRETLEKGHPFGVEDLGAIGQRSPLLDLFYQDNIRSLVIVPMLVHPELIGALLLEASTPHAFKTDDVDAALEVASLLAIAIRQTRLHTALEQRATQLARTSQLAQEALANAEAANRAKSVFLAHISHELRTPLNAILGFTQLITQQPDLNPEQREYLSIIERSGKHLLGLINNVLELSKIEAGRMPLQEENFDLYRMLNELREMFEPRAQKRNLDLVFEWNPEIPRFVCLDQGKLRQILINLLDNAIKFTPSGRVALRMTNGFTPTEPRRNLLHFEIEDTGPGITPEEQEVIFAPFGRTATASAIPGTGLGLAISQQLVRMLGGELVLQSHAGAGSRFSFDVGYASAAIGDTWQTDTSAQRILSVKPGFPIYRILIADDEEISRWLLSKTLAPLGLETREARDGAEALALWKTWKPHLIFMDVRMPNLNGHELLHHIRITAQDQKTVIIALTAIAFEEERAALLDEGCNDFIRKPYLRTEIYTKLTQHLGLEYVFAEPEPVDTQPEAGEEKGPNLVNAIRSLPAEWRASLRDATINGDLSSIEDSIEQIRDTQPSLAEELHRLANAYDHDSILALLT